MPKYYVSSGEDHRIMDRPTIKQAAMDFLQLSLKKDAGVGLEFIVYVSETGFRVKRNFIEIPGDEEELSETLRRNEIAFYTTEFLFKEMGVL